MKTAIFFCLVLAASGAQAAPSSTEHCAYTTGKISLWGNEGVDRDTHIFKEVA